MSEADTPNSSRGYNPRSRENLRQYRSQQPQQPVDAANPESMQNPIALPMAGGGPISGPLTPNQSVAWNILDRAAQESAAFLVDVATGRHKVKHAAAVKVRADVAFGVLELAGVSSAVRNHLPKGRFDDPLRLAGAELEAFVQAGARALELRRARESAVDAEIVTEPAPAAGT